MLVNFDGAALPVDLLEVLSNLLVEANVLERLESEVGRLRINIHTLIGCNSNICLVDNTGNPIGCFFLGAADFLLKILLGRGLLSDLVLFKMDYRIHDHLRLILLVADHLRLALDRRDGFELWLLNLFSSVHLRQKVFEIPLARAHVRARHHCLRRMAGMVGVVLVATRTTVLGAGGLGSRGHLGRTFQDLGWLLSFLLLAWSSTREVPACRDARGNHEALVVLLA